MENSAGTGADLVESHRAAKSRMRMLRITFPLLIIIIVVWNVYALAKQVQDIDTEAVANHMEGQFHKLWPRIEEDLTMIAKDIEPVLEAEIGKQSAKMASKIDARLQTDVEALKKQVEKDFTIEVEKALNEVERRQRQVLVDHIPELKSDRKAQDKVLEAVRVALIKWSMKQLTSTLHEHMVAMESIRRTLQKSYTAPAGAKVNPEEAIVLWLDLMNESVGGDSTILAPRETPEPVKSNETPEPVKSKAPPASKTGGK